MDNSEAINPGTQISTIAGQCTQASPAPRPSSMPPAAASNSVVSNNPRRNAGASGSCGAGKALITRSVTSDMKASAKTNAAARLAVVAEPGGAVTAPDASFSGGVSGHANLTTSQISSVPAGTMSAWHCRAANPGSSHRCGRREVELPAENRKRAQVNVSVPRSTVSGNNSVVSVSALRPPETASRAMAPICGRIPVGNKAAHRNTPTAAHSMANSQVRRRMRRCDRGTTVSGVSPCGFCICDAFADQIGSAVKITQSTRRCRLWPLCG